VPYDTTNSRSGLFYYQNKFQIDYECLGEVTYDLAVTGYKI
jgi:hypothetical protein